MKRSTHHNASFKFACFILSALTVSCAEQPSGYIFTIKHRDKVNVARQAADFISDLYTHSDQAAAFLSDAGLTTDYRSILPDGWVDSTNYDSLGQPRAPFFDFFRNYLDKQYYALAFPSVPTPGSVRNPDRIWYNFVQIASVQNTITNEFYGQANQIRSLQASYSDNLTNSAFIEGWFSIRKVVKFEQEMEISIGGRSTRQTIPFYLSVPWMMRIERFSVNSNDQRGRIIIDGVFPILDETNIIQNCHVSGEFNIAANGTGEGEVWLYGERTAHIIFTGRTFGFTGWFTLFDENETGRYSL